MPRFLAVRTGTYDGDTEAEQWIRTGMKKVAHADVFSSLAGVNTTWILALLNDRYNLFMLNATDGVALLNRGEGPHGEIPPALGSAGSFNSAQRHYAWTTVEGKEQPRR